LVSRLEVGHGLGRLKPCGDGVYDPVAWAAGVRTRRQQERDPLVVVLEVGLKLCRRRVDPADKLRVVVLPRQPEVVPLYLEGSKEGIKERGMSRKEEKKPNNKGRNGGRKKEGKGRTVEGRTMKG
jgi:hypothetical protein